MGLSGRITVAAVLGAVITVGQSWLLALQAVPTTFTVPVVPGATYSWPAPVPSTWPVCKESVRWRGVGMEREQASDQNAFSSRVSQYFVTRDVLGWPMDAMESVRREYLPLSGAGAIRVEAVGLESGIRVRRGSGPAAFESFLPLRPLAVGFAVNTLLYTMVAFGVLTIVARWRASRRRRDGECAACGYELAGLRTCAECGNSLSGLPEDKAGLPLQGAERCARLPRMRRMPLWLLGLVCLLGLIGVALLLGSCGVQAVASPLADGTGDASADPAARAVAEKFDRVYARRGEATFHERASTFLVTVLETNPGGGLVAVDLGAGEGRNSIPLARAGYAVTAIDLSSAGLARIRERCQQERVSVQTVLADVRRVEFRRESVHLVLAAYFPLDDGLIEQLKVATAPGGLVVIEGHAGTIAGGYPLNEKFVGWVIEIDERAREHPDWHWGRSDEAIITRFVARKPSNK